MSELRLGSRTIVATNSISSSYYGGFSFIGAVLNSEIYQRSSPGTSGIYEVKSGDRSRIITVRCTWHTRRPGDVEDMLFDLQRSVKYERLQVSDGLGSDRIYRNCRLSDVSSAGEGQTGVINGGLGYVMSRTLSFLQVRF